MNGHVAMDLDTIALEFFERVIGSEVCGNTVKSAAVHDANTAGLCLFVIVLDALGDESGLTRDVAVRRVGLDAGGQQVFAIKGIGADRGNNNFGLLTHRCQG